MFFAISADLLAQSRPKDNQFIFFPRMKWGWNYFHMPLAMDFPVSGYEIKKRSLWAGNEEGRKGELDDFYAGFKIVLVRPRSHVGGFLYMDYKNKGFVLKSPGAKDWITHKSHIFSPALGLRIVTGNFTKTFHWVFEGGAAYNYAFKYKGSYNDDINVVNNGFTSIVGFGFDIMPGRRDKEEYDNHTYNKEKATKDSYFSLTIQYHKDLFNYFNENYTPDKVSYPYKGFKSNFGYLAITMTIRGSMQFEQKTSY